MDTAQWPQEVGLVKTMEECSKPMMLEGKAKPHKDQALNCPRCNSTNTKFCYYNNYSLTQPRYFCKTCRRYWTEGGSLRNVPVGGGSRKYKRSTSSSSSSSTSAASSHKLPDLNPPSLSNFSSQNPKTHEGQDLNPAFPPMQDYLSSSQFVELPKIQNNNSTNHHKSSFSSPPRGLNTFIPTPTPDSNTLYASGFSLLDLKPCLSFPVDGFGSSYVSLHGVEENSGRLMFPFGALKHFSSTSTEVDQNKGQGSSTGYWNGMVGGGSW